MTAGLEEPSFVGVNDGYSEAYEHEHIFELSKQLRALHVVAMLKLPGSDGEYYFAFLFVSDWDTYGQLFDPLD